MRGQSCPSEGSVGRLTRPLNSASGTVLEEVLAEIRVQTGHLQLTFRGGDDDAATPDNARAATTGGGPTVEMHSKL